MRILWGRIVGACVAVGIGTPAFLYGGLWLTCPSPGAVERFAPGPSACSTATLLEAGVVLHDGHTEPDDTDRLAADVLLAAARCGGLADVPVSQAIPVFRTSRHALEWIEANESGEAALNDALTVWELATDQRRVGPLINFGIWTAIGAEAAKIVERELGRRGLPDGARDDAHPRLRRIASAPLDWAQIHVREERSMWEVVRRSASDPEAWLHLPEGFWMLVQARQGTHRFVADFEKDEVADRRRATRLATL